MDCKYIKADTVLPYSSALVVKLNSFVRFLEEIDNPKTISKLTDL